MAKKFEYKSVLRTIDTAATYVPIDEALNVEGKEGWELTGSNMVYNPVKGVAYEVFYLKRKKEDPC